MSKKRLCMVAAAGLLLLLAACEIEGPKGPEAKPGSDGKVAATHRRFDKSGVLGTVGQEDCRLGKRNLAWGVDIAGYRHSVP
jgi:hypothetical protein